MLDHLSLFGLYRFAVSNNTLYRMQKRWDVFAYYDLQSSMPPALFQSLPSSLEAAFSVTRFSPFATIVVDLDIVDSEMSSKNEMVAKEFHTYSHAEYLTIAVSVRTRDISSTIKRLPKNDARALRLQLRQQLQCKRTCWMLRKLQSRCIWHQNG